MEPGVVTHSTLNPSPRFNLPGTRPILLAILYLMDAATVTGHILYVDGGAHFGRW